MTNKVLYLCRSSKAKPGWVFPDEEEDCDFPGGFFIEEQAGKLQDSYLLEAISQEKLVILSLQKKERQIFMTPSPAGKIFYFRARRTKEPYVGKRSQLQHHQPFWRLEVLQPQRLEEACQQDGFYFVGAVEEEFI